MPPKGASLEDKRNKLLSQETVDKKFSLTRTHFKCTRCKKELTLDKRGQFDDRYAYSFNDFEKHNKECAKRVQHRGSGMQKLTERFKVNTGEVDKPQAEVERRPCIGNKKFPMVMKYTMTPYGGHPAWYTVGAELFPEKAKTKKRRVHIEDTYPISAHEDGEDVESGEVEATTRIQDACGSRTAMSIDFKSLTSDEVDSLRHTLRTMSQYHYDETLNTIFSAKCKGATVDGDCCTDCQMLDKNDSLRKRERFVSVFYSFLQYTKESFF
jgi:hypothetical protein